MPVTGQPRRTRSPNFAAKVFVITWFPPLMRKTFGGHKGTPRSFRTAACQITCKAEPELPISSIAAGDAPSFLNTSLKRSEEHTSELQSRLHLVCRLLLE